MAVVTNHETAIYREDETRTSGVMGWTTFAATMMVIIGVFDILYGIAAIAKDKYFVVGTEYLYKFDVTTWGWIHVVLGAVVLVAGFALFGDALWARTLGVVMAGLNMIANFISLPYYPVWSIIIIAVDVFVIWALMTPRSDY